jgi:phosphoribosylaminoimidazole carboxylase (NCAIR synthetase)
MAYSERGVEPFVLSLAAPYDMTMVELYINEVAPRVGASGAEPLIGQGICAA